MKIIDEILAETWIDQDKEMRCNGLLAIHGETTPVLRWLETRLRGRSEGLRSVLVKYQSQMMSELATHDVQNDVSKNDRRNNTNQRERPERSDKLIEKISIKDIILIKYSKDNAENVIYC